MNANKTNALLSKEVLDANKKDLEEHKQMIRDFEQIKLLLGDYSMKIAKVKKVPLK